MIRYAGVASAVVLTVVLACSVAHGAPSLYGPTGILFTPNAEVVGASSLDIGAHFMEEDGGDMSAYKATVGVCDRAEVTGTLFSLENGGDEDEFLVSAKAQVVSGEDNGLSVAIGGMDIFEQVAANAMWYVVATKTMGDAEADERVVQASVGLLISEHIDMDDDDDAQSFASIAAELCDRVTALVEMFGEDVSFGGRVSVGDNFNVDVASVEFYGHREFLVGGAYHVSF